MMYRSIRFKAGYVVADIEGVRFDRIFVRCVKRGTVVGVINGYSVPGLPFNAAKKRGAILR